MKQITQEQKEKLADGTYDYIRLKYETIARITIRKLKNEEYLILGDPVLWDNKIIQLLAPTTEKSISITLGNSVFLRRSLP